MASTCVLSSGTKVAGFDSNGMLYAVQLNQKSVLIFKFNPLTQKTDLVKSVPVYQNQPIDETMFHVSMLSKDDNYLGVYVQYSEFYYSKDQPPSWFLEINLANLEEVRRNPCSFPKLEPELCSLVHTDSRWGWILGGFALGEGAREFEFHSFRSGIGKGCGNEFFDASVLTVAESVTPLQRFGVMGDNLYSIYPESDGGWKFCFFDLNSEPESPGYRWNDLRVSESVSGTLPEKIVRLFLVDNKLCALELTSERVAKVWKVERGRSGGTITARWNLWKRFKTPKTGDRLICDLVISPKLSFTCRLIALILTPSERSKILLNSIRMAFLDVPTLKFISAMKFFEHCPNQFEFESKVSDYFSLRLKTLTVMEKQ